MTLGNMLAETYASWLQSVSFCCCGVDDKSRSDVEHKPRVILRDQPARVAPPSAEPLWTNEGSFEKPWEGESPRGRRRPSSSWSRGTAGTPWFSKSSSSTRRRPKISNPSNFRHLHSESFQFPAAEPEPALPEPVEKRSSFHPLELSYQPRDHTFSPLLNYFSATADDDVDRVTPPPRAHTAANRWDSPSLRHERSYSPMSFHIPRKHLRDGSFGSSAASAAPSIPTKSRARAYTSPSPAVDTLVERIASAMIEKDRLDAEIESIIERQSLYISSRPSTAYGPEDPTLSPMPSIPALPATNAPSFAERLSSDTSPGPPTPAPTERTMTPQERTIALTKKAAALGSHPYHHHGHRGGGRRPITPPQQHRRMVELDRPLAPPLPLVLRPPLRKKKSFSGRRVSRWLFPGGGEVETGLGLERQGSVTNAPRPVRGGEGYYQSVESGEEEKGGGESTSGWETESGQTTPRAGVTGTGTGQRGSVGVAF
ncbi:hypothetical protein QBC39DRAFT_61219 [Podospora conica]|nr:hypothetical protein QBC39DRAFT_61219 [Schizothecium conicum]